MLHLRKEMDHCSLVCRKRMYEINNFKGMSIGNQWDVAKQMLRETLQKVYILVTPEKQWFKDLVDIWPNEKGVQLKLTCKCGGQACIIPGYLASAPQ